MMAFRRAAKNSEGDDLRDFSIITLTH
jgi:hypothetical protein